MGFDEVTQAGYVTKDMDTDTDTDMAMIPNSKLDAVKRAVASEMKETTMNSTLLEIRSMSMSLRDRVYEMAQSKASLIGRVIVIFGAGRFQEWRQMSRANLSYIAIDPNIDVTTLQRNGSKFKVMPYDFSIPFSKQVATVAELSMTVLWAACTSMDFIRRTNPIPSMASQEIPAVFSFSISYHIDVINMLKSHGVSTFGCGYVHDDLPETGIGDGPFTMVPKGTGGENITTIIATCGDATYEEPYLSLSSIPDMVLVRTAMTDLWQRVTSNTIAIMERAVLMCG